MNYFWRMRDEMCCTMVWIDINKFEEKKNERMRHFKHIVHTLQTIIKETKKKIIR